MKTNYKGYEIDVFREESLGGEDMIYWSVFRDSDGMEMTSGFEYYLDFGNIRRLTKHLKSRVDNWFNLPVREQKDSGNF